jgi:DNA modification methylase
MYFQGFRFVVIHYIEDIIKYIVPYMGVPTKVVQWVYNSNMGKQHRSIAFFNCKPDFSKVKQPYKNLKDKRIIKNILNGSEGSRLYDWWNINLVKGNVPEKEDYSNQIPEQVISNIIKIVAQENDVIFDPFMGSGTTPAVASKLGFK